MKRVSICTTAIFLFFVARSQNIGIGITTPRAKLHVFNGASGNSTPYSPMVVENNGHTYINLLSPDANESAILFGKAIDAASGGIIYNNTATPNGLQFRTNGNINRMVILDNGNVGIGTAIPNAPLAFPAAIGKKITLYPGGTGDMGFSVQANLLRIYSDHPASDIAFGYDQGGFFNERFRIRGNGAIAVNGSFGAAGQFLRSNGNAPPTWSSATNDLYNNTILYQTSATTTINSENPIVLPGLSQNLTVTTNVKVLVNFTLHATASFCFACGPTDLVIDLELNGFLRDRYRQDIPNDNSKTISGTALLILSPGTYSISFEAYRYGPDVSLGHTFLANNVVLMIIPQ